MAVGGLDGGIFRKRHDAAHATRLRIRRRRSTTSSLGTVNIVAPLDSSQGRGNRAHTARKQRAATVTNRRTSRVVYLQPHIWLVEEPASGSFDRTATGDGLGSASTVSAYIRVRTATADGTGGASTTALTARSRTATTSGTGGSSSTETITGSFSRTATGEGTGGVSTTTTKGPARTASGSGVGASTSAETVSFMRVATGSGVGAAIVLSGLNTSRTASGVGVGGQFTTGSYRVLRVRLPSSGLRVTKKFYTVDRRLFTKPPPPR